jgi:hypothetical protein
VRHGRQRLQQLHACGFNLPSGRHLLRKLILLVLLVLLVLLFFFELGWLPRRWLLPRQRGVQSVVVPERLLSVRHVPLGHSRHGLR